MTRLSDLVGGDPVTITTAAGAPLVPATHAGRLSLRRGRETVDAAPAASTLTFLADAAAWLSTAGRRPEIADPVNVDLTPAALAYFDVPADDARRFGGRISDVQYVPTVSARRPAGVYQITATGPLSLLGNLPGVTVDQPEANDAQRVDAVLDAASAGGDLFAYVPGYDAAMYLVPVAADQLAGQKADAQLADLCKSTGGDVWEFRAGHLRYLSRTYRQWTEPEAEPYPTLPASAVSRATEWRLTRGGLLNAFAVDYGLAAGYAAGSFARRDDGSIAKYGTYDGGTLRSLLAYDYDAEWLCTELVSTSSEPHWSVPDLIVDLTRTVSPALAGQLLALDVNSLVGLDGWPAYVPLTAGRLFVEGWTETIHGAGWELRFNVSDFGITGNATTWLDVPPGLTWLDVTPSTRSWFGARAWTP